jgi:hypothetical protein
LPSGDLAAGAVRGLAWLVDSRDEAPGEVAALGQHRVGSSAGADADADADAGEHPLMLDVRVTSPHQLTIYLVNGMTASLPWMSNRSRLEHAHVFPEAPWGGA